MSYRCDTIDSELCTGILLFLMKLKMNSVFVNDSVL